MDRLEASIRDLPPDLRREVEDFVAFLLQRRAPERKGGLRLDWRGELRDLKDGYDSVALQHEASRWRE